VKEGFLHASGEIQKSKVKNQNDNLKCKFLTFALSLCIFIFTFCISEAFIWDLIFAGYM